MAALAPLVKGKMTLDKTKIVRFIDVPGKVDYVDERVRVACEVLYVSEVQILGQTFTWHR